MPNLLTLSDPVSLQVLCDALSERGIDFRVDNAGMHALMPLPDVMDIRVFVEDEDMAAAQRIVDDLKLRENDG
ncbi:MAG: DUF2007 domain-containing protein [Mariprofundaceae bacterium]|nr:DUF2007 domain-containing protein [Mariprofundaceae bacterium]